MHPAEIFSRLEKQFSEKVSGFKADVPEPYLFVGAEAIVEVCRFLRDDAELNFEVLSDQTAVDWPKEEKIQLVYHLYSYGGTKLYSKLTCLETIQRSRPLRIYGKLPTGSNARSSICSGLSLKVTAICAGYSCLRIGRDIPCARTTSSRKNTMASARNALRW